MDIEKIKLLFTLKQGETFWKKGMILQSPFPAPIIEEIRGVLSRKIIPPTIEILERKGQSVISEKPKIEIEKTDSLPNQVLPETNGSPNVNEIRKPVRRKSKTA
uniref:Uncharacterized protein n=1 Tax=viral metagenome TaxID=1070528 RepID=A0A6M3J6I6_9ZZZZ